MADTFGAIVAAGIVGTIAWAINKSAEADKAEAQPVVYTRTASRNSGLKSALFGILGDSLGNIDFDRIGSNWGKQTPQPTSAGYTPKSPQPVATPRSSGLAGLFNLIGGIEAPEGYNQMYGGSKIQPPKPLTQMTVGEVLAYQDRSVAAGSRSSAAGRYQVIRGTLRSSVRDGTVKTSDVYNEATQDKIALGLANRRGLGQYQAGRITETQFAQNLSKEWASLPVATKDKRGRAARGQSYYAGDGLNKSLTSLDSVLNAIRGI